METILEQQRRYHEERERLVDAMVKEMLHKKTSVSNYSSPIMEFLTFSISTGRRSTPITV